MIVLRASGWQPDLPDPRDYTLAHEQIAGWLRDLPRLAERPSCVDWRSLCTPCPDFVDLYQRVGSVHSCLELLEQYAFHLEGASRMLSRPFVHRTAQRLAEPQGLPPQSLRAVWKAIRRFGVPPADLWPGEQRSGESEPDAFAYSVARRYDNLRYLRLDRRDHTGADTLEAVRSCLAAGFLIVFGISLGTSARHDGEIGYPTMFDEIRGGQSLVATGYDDNRRIRSDRGCLAVRGCWGRDWGDEGYGWLPYTYVREKLASDFWMVLQPEWLASGEFVRPG